jgi:valyl-tRNA synthetase
VGHCYRCDSEIEPWLSGNQWFVAVDRLRGPAKAVVEDGRIRFSPQRWKRSYLDWLDNLRDWNISRQLWWGHRIPVWYCPNGHQFASVEDPEVCRECESAEIEQDPDVLDTWFSSQLWPFSTLGWPEQTPDLGFFYPTTALITGYEILYLWVARMIMSGLYLMGEIPFRTVVIHGLVRDAQGRKMSKSLGNVIDPLDMIERYGADALRFSVMRLANPEQQNIPLGEKAIEDGQHFANKIWNAARLVLSAYPGGPPELPAEDRRTPPERWLLSRHQACLEEVDAACEAYRFGDAARTLYRFLWTEYCDWALEIAKLRLYEGGEEERNDAANILAWVLERTMRTLHPFMPFVTEEIWQRLSVGESIVIAPWPEQHPEHRDHAAEREFGLAQDAVIEIRRWRKAFGLRDSEVVAGIHIRPRTEETARTVERFRAEISRLANVVVDSISDWVPSPEDVIPRVTPMADIYIPLGFTRDEEYLRAERASLLSRLEGLEDTIARSEAKLRNPGFLAKAAADIVAKERKRLAEAEEAAGAVRHQLERLSTLGE